MLGRTLDTQILRLISHDRNLMADEQIEVMADQYAANMSYTATEEDFLKFTQRAGSYFDWKGKKILEVACGKGDLANHLAMKGASEVYGLDIDKPRVKVAESFAVKNGVSNVHFFETDFHQWTTTEKFDYVISYEALDHIPDTRATLKKMAALLADDGRIINFAAGFWKAPIGADHCDDFMRFPIPWRQLLFNAGALFTIRKEKFRPSDQATCFKEIRGGLTMYTLTEYQEAIRDAGLKIVVWDTNYQLKHKYGGLLLQASRFLTRLPLLGEYFTFSVFSVLAK